MHNSHLITLQWLGSCVKSYILLAIICNTSFTVWLIVSFWYSIIYTCYSVAYYHFWLYYDLSLWRCFVLLLEVIQFLSSAFPFVSKFVCFVFFFWCSVRHYAVDSVTCHSNKSSLALFDIWYRPSILALMLDSIFYACVSSSSFFQDSYSRSISSLEFVSWSTFFYSSSFA